MNIPFIKNRKYWYIISGTFMLVSILSLLVWGFKLGIDFTGGSLLEVRFLQTQPSVQEVQSALQPLQLGTVSVQPADSNVMILRLPELSEDDHQKILQIMKINYTDVPPDQASSLAISDVIEELRFESIGPTIGQELKNKSVVAIILTLVFIILYIAYAFRKVSQPVASWKYGLVAIVALIHDILFLCGAFAIFGYFFGYEVNILFITALLTTLGYSVHDTIIVIDRTRENLFTNQDEEFAKIVNDSVNQTLTRSLNTTFTTLLVLFAIYLFGGETIKEFILALIIGFAIGTYSSIFIASPLLVDWHLLGSSNK